MVFFAILALFEKIMLNDPCFHRQSGWPSGLRLQTSDLGHSGVPGSNPARPLMKFVRFFFSNWRQKFSKSEALASLVIVLQRGMIEKTSYFRHQMQKTSYFQHSMSKNQLFSAQYAQKTSSENLRKPIRKFPLLHSQNVSNSEIKAYNGENLFA